MKLSELVKLKNAINDNVTVVDLLSVLDTLKNNLHITQNHSLGEYSEFYQGMENAINAIAQQITQINIERVSVTSRIDQAIADITKDYYARGYMINGAYATNHTSVEHERNGRDMPMNDHTRTVVEGKIQQYSHWKYPGLEIGPGDGKWTKLLVACDPLYIVDRHKEFLDNTVNQFNPEYRVRIRPYQTLGPFFPEDTDLSFLPDNQFGFIFSWNVFNHFPYQHCEAYLTHCFRILKPGGVMMFSYNNAEHHMNAAYVEEGFMSWMPRPLLIELVTKLGFEIITTESREEIIHWIEIRKPGELKTVKAHQVMGEIININH